MDIVNKNIEPTLNRILKFLSRASYTVNCDGHHLDKRPIEIIKDKREYKFTLKSKVLNGVQNNKEIQFNENLLIEFKKSDSTFFTHGKDILVNNISHDFEWNHKILVGTITSLSTAPTLNLYDDKYLRCVIPVGKKEALRMNEFQRRRFKTPQNKSSSFITSIIGNHEFHLFNYKLGEDYYFILDCLQSIDLSKFQKKCYCSLLVIGFITGKMIQDECFITSFEETQMETPVNTLYYSMARSVQTNQPIFTSNPFSVNSDIDFERDNKGLISVRQKEKLYENMIDFPCDVFSKLASLFYKNEKLQRAATIFVQSHLHSLEIKIPNFFVALEAITSHISSESIPKSKSLSPIKDKKIAKELITSVMDLTRKIKEKHGLDTTNFNLDILEKNINKLNAPPNADKLSKSFEFIGYRLNTEQRKILRERNRYLHGSFLKTISDDSAFREGLHISLRTSFMIAVLILKLAGFEGKIINYAALWSHITRKKLKEDRLILI